jgi:AbrB family looped-hinge helix DNA binding protein
MATVLIRPDGNSSVITLPKDLLALLGWNEGERVELNRKKQKIIISPIGKK